MALSDDMADEAEAMALESDFIASDAEETAAACDADWLGIVVEGAGVDRAVDMAARRRCGCVVWPWCEQESGRK